MRRRLFVFALAFALTAIAVHFADTVPLSALSTAGTTIACGGEGEKPCAADTDFFWDNGNLFCDRGLKATGFRVLPDISFNGNDWVNLDRINLTDLLNIINVELPALKARLSNLTKSDFLSDTCLGFNIDGTCYAIPPIPGEDVSGCRTNSTGCAPNLGIPCFIPGTYSCTFNTSIPGVTASLVPIPDFSKSGWSVASDVVSFVNRASAAVNNANLPAAIKGIPGGAPTLTFSASKYDVSPQQFADALLSGFTGDFDALKGILDDSFFGQLANLVKDFTDPPGLCMNKTRQQTAPAAFAQTWAHWAFLDQTNLAVREPLNWYPFVSPHNGYNNVADGYLLPNQRYSFTDQLNIGGRGLSLDLHYVSGRVRLCHADGGLGCAATDRWYSNGIKEIGNWVRAHPGEVIYIGFEDKSEDGDDAKSGGGPRDAEVNDPLDRYLRSDAGKSLIYTPADAANAGFVFATHPDGSRDVGSTIWPSVADIQRLGKQVMIFSPNTHGGTWIWSDPVDDGSSNPTGIETSFYVTTPDYAGTGQPPENTGGPFACWTYTATAADPKPFRLTGRGLKDNDGNPFPHTSQVGSVTQIRESRSLLDAFAPAGVIDEARMAQLMLCQLSYISLDQLMATEDTPPATCTGRPLNTCIKPDNRLAAAVWSWRDGDKGDKGNAAMLNGSDGRWSSRDSKQIHPFACAQPRRGSPSSWTDVGGNRWAITSAADTWDTGPLHCALEYGDQGFVFGVPVTGWMNKQLQSANVAGADVWVNYGKTAAGTWDSGGGSGSGDATPPQVSGTVTGTTGTNGWYKSNTQISWTVADAESPIIYKQGCDTVTLTEDTAGRTLTCMAITAAGLRAQASVTVKIDKTPPSITVSRTPANAAGWNNSVVTAQFTATDAGSGVAGSASFDAQLSSEGAAQQVTHLFSDLAGNVASATVSGINIDKTKPTVTFASPTTPPNAACWYNTDVLIPYTATDALSGLASALPASPIDVSQQGAAVNGSVIVTDKAGNTTTFYAPAVKIDTTPPVLRSCVAVPSILWPPNHKLEPVQVVIDAVDALSTIAQVTLVSATSNEADPGSISGFEIGTSDTSGFIRSERNGNGSGRVYSLKYVATDVAGNAATCIANILVPHDQGQDKK